MSSVVTLGQIAERSPETEERDWDQDVNGRVSGDVGELVVPDEQPGGCCAYHAGDPSITERTVPTRPHDGSQAGPESQGSQQNRAGCESDVDRDGGCELHGVGLTMLTMRTLNYWWIM